MIKINFLSEYIWNSILLVTVICAVFVLPFMPVEHQRYLYYIAYTIIYISALLSLNKKSKTIVVLFVFTLVLYLGSEPIDLHWLSTVSKSANIIFFLVVVVSLITQIAKSLEVKTIAILGSIAGYLLLGLVYSIFVNFIFKVDPGAYSNLPEQLDSNGYYPPGLSLYYSFVTLSSLGYGDIYPLKPYARSLATFMAVSGQFYIAIIVALLVGKFSSQQRAK